MKSLKLLFTFLFIILLNVILTGFLAVSIKRPIIYYEYIFLPLVFVIIQKHLYKVLLLLGLILLDISYNVSHLYYFDIFNYFEKLPYLLIAKFEISLYILVIFSFLLLIGVCHLLTRLFEIKVNTLENKFQTNVIFSFTFFIIVYLIDSLNGSTLWSGGGRGIIHISTRNKKEFNVGKSLIRDIYKDYNIYKLGTEQVHDIPDYINLNKDSSLSYKYFYNSKSNKEVIIVMESWGLLVVDSLLQVQLNHFKKLDSNKFKYNFEKSYFDGSTLSAESRELLNKEGEAYFSVIKHNNCDIKTIVNHKMEENYETLAVQGFDGTYSVGSKFKKLIGFQTFKDYSYFHDTLGYRTIYNNQYQSISDEDLFKYVFTNSKKSKKNFTYCLTINTHLPFRLNRRNKKSKNYTIFKKYFKNSFPSEEVLDRYYRMNQELEYLVQQINSSDVDKVLIIGDHAPPFIYKVERDLFEKNLVPAIYIERKN